MAKLTYVFSSMNSGKTLALLTKNFMLREKGYRTLLIKPELDNRTSTISSRIGLKEKCLLIGENQSVVDAISKVTDYEYRNGFVHYILVDEAQFLTNDQVWELSDLVDYDNINVICYGIKINWKGELFEGSKALLTIADELQQMDSFCKETGNPALFHHKIGGSDAAIETGYEETYETVSRKLWKEKRNRS
jgi:thymidine kinase